MPDTRSRPRPKRRTPEQDRLVERDGLLVFTGPLHPSPEVNAFNAVEHGREERHRMVSGIADDEGAGDRADR